MKKIFNSLFLLLTLAVAAVSCSKSEIDNLTPTNAGSLVVNQESIAFYGDLREKEDVEGSYINIPYYSTTGARLEITEVEIPSGLSLDKDVQVAIDSSNSGSFNIFIYGTPEVYGAAVPFEFVLSNNAYTEVIRCDVRIYGNGEQRDNLTIESLSLSDSISKIYRFVENEGEITISYKNGGGRTISVAATGDDGSSFTFESDQIKLPNDDGEVNKISIPISAVYNKVQDADSEDTMDVEFVISYRDGNNYSQSISKVKTLSVESKPLTFTSSSVEGTIAQGENTDFNLVLYYENGEARTITYNVVSFDNLPIMVDKEETVNLNETSGYISIPCSGAPTEGNLAAEISFTGDYIDDNDDTSYDTADDKIFLVNPITINSVDFDACYVDLSSTKHILEVSYTGGCVGAPLRLSSISGFETFVGLDLSQIASVEPFITEAVSGVATFDISALLTDGTISESTTYPTDVTLKVGISYTEDRSQIAEGSGLVAFNGFRWDGYDYAIVTVGGERWLDRNLRAKTKEVGDIDPTAKTLTEWEVVPGVYGAYYQRGRATGLDMVNTDECVAQPFKTTYLTEDLWAENIWATYNTDILPASPMTMLETDYIALMDSSWNTTDGGANNPCPPGFRVPTMAELTDMVNTVAGGKTTIPALFASNMKLAPSGMIHQGGPTTDYLSSATTLGEQYMPGYYFNRETEVTTSSAGYINLMSSDYCPWGDIVTSTKTLYCRSLQVSSSGTVSTKETNRAIAMPVRAIKK